MPRQTSVLFLLVALAILCMPLHAQTVDTAIVGTVTDSTGAVLPGATVTASSETTGIKKTAVTTSAGEYNFTYLTPGNYDVTVSAQGFSSSQRKGIELQINQQARIDIAMNVGSANQQIEVQAIQPLLQSESSSLGAVIGTKSAETLPLNGRKFNDLAILTPGINVYNPDNHSSVEDGAAITAYGAQQTWSQVNVDGVTMVNNRHAYVNLYPSVDAIQEFKVFTGNAEAEYGGGAGTVTNIQLKTGTNALHGNLFEFVRNTAMDARNYFIDAPNPKQVLKQNQFGGTIGGPIVKDHAFFFFSYEGLRSIEQTAGLTTVLTSAEKNGDFSALLPQTQLYSPFTGLPYLNNQIPVDPVAQNIAQKYMPLPNTNKNGENYAFVAGGYESVNQYIARLDDTINDRNQIAFHFLQANRKFPNSDPNPNFSYNGTFPIYNVGLQYIHTISPRMINELRLGYDFEHQKLFNTLANTNFTAASIGINGFVQPGGDPWPPSQEGFPVLSTDDLIGMGSGQGIGIDDSRTYQIVDNLTWNRGNHSLIFGGDIRHNQDNADTSNTPYGEISFNGAETASTTLGGGYDGADFILGIPSSIITPEGVPLTAARQWRTGLYAQDNWKVTPKLTLNLGLRWDLWSPPHDNLNTSRTLNWSTPTPTIENLPTPLWKVSHKDFSPRLGFAYSLPRQFVVRGGYGITYYGGQFDNINILQLNPPADPSFTLNNGTSPANPPTATIENPISPSITPQTANVVSLPPNGKHPDLYLQTYNLTLSKQFWSNVIDVSYVGVKGTHQDTSITSYNSGPPQASGTVNGNRPYPTFGNIRMLDFAGASRYNGLNVRFEHRFSHQLEFTTSYSFSHFRDNQGGDTNGVHNQTQVPRAKEWANGLTDQRHNLTIAFVWQLPKFSGGNIAARALLNGWGFNGIVQYLSGVPLFITQGADGENNGNAFERPDLVPGQALTVPHPTIAEWFNTAAFTQANGHYGSTPRNPSPLTSPSTKPVTLAISRSFALPFEHQQHLDFRLEAFNALNHPQFGAPGTVQGSGNFGVIDSTINNNRELQLALKYIF